jgi:hypothetical protein
MSLLSVVKIQSNHSPEGTFIMSARDGIPIDVIIAHNTTIIVFINIVNFNI